MNNSEELRKKAEEELKKQKSKSSGKYSEIKKLELIHELEVHQIELEMQLDEVKSANEKSELAQEKYLELFDFAPIGYFLLLKDSKIIELNLRGSQMLNKERSLLINTRLNNYISFDSQPTFIHFLEKIFSSGVTETCELTMSVSEYPLIHVLLNGKISDNKKFCFVSMTDISNRKKTENLLKETRNKLNLAIENGKISIWEWNLQNNEFLWDKKVFQLFKEDNKDTIKSFNDFMELIHEEDIPHVKKTIKSALEENVPFITIFRIKLIDGNYNYISAKALLYKDPQGKPIKFQGVFINITDLKTDTEKVIHKLNEDLLRSNKELAQFAYIASHDLQEPLRMVSSFTQLLAEQYKDKLSQDANDYIKFAVDGAKKMQNLIQDLLSFSRVQTKGREFTLVNLNEIIEQVKIQLSLIINEKKAKINFAQLPIIKADERQMFQLFQNLIGNALKFCDRIPEIHISSTSSIDCHTFVVQDNGIGIESQYFDRIFQIFQRLFPKNDYTGTGIGLAICKRIVERHGGKIWLESSPNAGTKFYFTISNYTI